MGTQITTTGLYAQSLTPRERSKHRAWIGVKVEAALSHHWTDDPSDLVKQEILRDWMEALENYTEAEIRAAFRQHTAERPNQKPKPGNIRALVIAQRQRDMATPALPMPKEEQERLAAEQSRHNPERAAAAKRIMQEIMGK